MEDDSSSRFINFERGESSRSNNNDENHAEDYEMHIAQEDESELETCSTRDKNGKEVFSEEQIEIMEKVFAIFRHPLVGFLKEVMQEHLILSDLQLEDIKIWFRERRARENRQRESIFLQMAHKRLTDTFVVLGENIQNNVKGTPQMFYHDFIRYALRNVPPGINDIDTVFKRFWYHPQAILCCSFKPMPVCLLANQAALDMLETNLENVQDISVFQIFEASRLDKISSMIEKITTKHGYDLLPRGMYETLKGNCVSYDQALTWKVIGDDGTIEGFAIEFNHWSLC